MDTATLTPAFVAVQAVAAEMADALEGFSTDVHRSVDAEIPDLVRSWAQVMAQAQAGICRRWRSSTPGGSPRPTGTCPPSTGCPRR